MRGFGTWLWNLLIWLDQGLNAMFGWALNLVLRPTVARFGSPDETLSSVLGKNVRAGACTGCQWICKLLNSVDPDHCTKSIEPDEGDNKTIKEF